MSIPEDVATADSSQTEPNSSSQQPSPPKIDLQNCPPDELATWLLAYRFQDNAMDVASFLLNCTSTLPNAEKISAQLLGGGRADDEDCKDDNFADENESEMEDAENQEAKTSDEKMVEATGHAKPADPQTQLLRTIRTSRVLPAFAENDSNNETEVSCTNPRGKFLLSVHEHGVVLTNPKKREEEQIPISAPNVKHVVWFRKPEDYKKVKQLRKNNGDTGGKSGKGVPGHMVLICLEDANDDGSKDGTIAFRNKPLKQVCFQLPSYPIGSSSTDDADCRNKQLTEEEWWNGLSTALFSGDAKTNNGIIRVHATMENPKGSSNGFVFESEGEQASATTTQAMPYVGCYQGFNDGALFPLREGLLFFKPPLFVPRSKLASISCGRGSGGSRYVDMVIQLESASGDEQEGKKKKKSSSDALEFTNIHRDELTGLNDYIHKTLIPAMQMDADGTSIDDSDSNNVEDVVAEVVNTSDEGQSNSDEEEGSGKRRRPSRAASKSAREINRAALGSAPAGKGDDDSDDSDEFEEEEEESDSDDSVASDEESESDSSEDEEEEMDDGSDGSDYEDGRLCSKKARVE